MARVLIIDDDPSFSELVRLNLELRGGYQVEEVNDPAQALRCARRFGPHVILLDVVMPGVGGVELLNSVTADPLLCDVPVVFITGLPQEVDTLGRSVWSKPSPMDSLLTLVAEALRSRESVP